MPGGACRAECLREAARDGGGVEHRGDIPILREIQECRADPVQHRIEVVDLVFPQAAGELKIEDGVGCVHGFAGFPKIGDVVSVPEIGVQANEADGSGGELLLAAGAIGIHFDPPSVAGVAAFHRVRRMDAGHEVGRPTGGAGRGGRDMDVAEQPGVEAGLVEVTVGHVEIALVGIEPEALDIPVGDPDVEHARWFFLSGNPADGVLLAMLAGAGAGVEADLVIVEFKVLGARFGQGEHATAVRSGAELFPELAIRSFAEIMVAGENKGRLASEFSKDLYRPLDLGLGESGFIEQVACDDDEVRLAVVGGGYHPFERGVTFFDQSFPGSFRVLVEGKTDVVVGGVENAEAHGEVDSIW